MGKMLQAAALAAVFMYGANAWGGEKTEVIHWWTTGSENAALKVMVDSFAAKGGVWQDSPVATGDAAKTVARTRLFAGTPPQAMMWQPGPPVLEMAKEGILADMQDIAVAGNWDAVLPKVLQEAIKFNGKYYAVPTDIHGLSWLWANKVIFNKLGVAVPKTWDEFNAIAPKIKAAGYIPLAMGGQPWQERVLFVVTALGVGGSEYYTNAFNKLDPAALNSEILVKIFDQFIKLKQWVDPASKGRDYDLTANLLVKGKAATFIMGDWAKGEFKANGAELGKDYVCQLAPGTENTYMFSADVWVMPKDGGDNLRADQKLLAGVMMDPVMQEKLNLFKGSIPPRSDVSVDRFDACAQTAIDQVTKKSDKLVLAIEVALTTPVVAAITDTASLAFNSNISAADAAEKLRKAIAEASR